MSGRGAAFGQILLCAILFSTGGAAVKASALSSWQIASFRSGIAALALLLLLPEARRGWSRRTWLIAIAYAATLVLFVHANKLTTAANTIFLQATAPLWVLMLGPRLLGEVWRRRDLLLFAAFTLGLVFCFLGAPPAYETAPAPMAGNLLAAASGLTYALTLIGLRAAGSGTGDTDSRTTPLAAITCGNVLAFCIGIGWSLPITAIGGLDLAVILYLGIFQVGVAYILLAAAIRHLTALETSLLLLLEPILSPVWARLLHGEEPGALALVGGVVIVAATAGKAWLELSFQRRAAGTAVE